ncbi:MAG: hypothetical protein AB1898_23435 [Acidobacteriota bacterium]
MFSISLRRLLPVMMALLWFLAAHPASLFSQWLPHCMDPRFDLLKAYWMGVEFQQRQQEYRDWQNQERRRVPIYNARLNGAVVAFHKHIVQDDHYLTTNCSICRAYLQEIKSYSKKIERAMK